MVQCISEIGLVWLIVYPISDFVKGFAKKFVLSEMRGESGRISSVCRIDAAG